MKAVVIVVIVVVVVVVVVDVKLVSVQECVRVSQLRGIH